MYNNPNVLNWYQDSKNVDIILSFLNSLNYTTHIFLQLFFLYIALGGVGMAQKSYIPRKAIYALIPLGLVCTVINYYTGYYVSYIGFVILSVITIFLLQKNIKRKSFKWISTSLLAFMVIVLGIYLGALALVVKENNMIMQTLEINNYSIHYKAFLNIYNIGDSLMTVNYNVQNIDLKLDNDIIYKRIYIHYYFLNTFLTLFWFGIYLKVLRMHGIKLLK